MPKPPVHPIQKMQDACLKAYRAATLDKGMAAERQVMRRHVRPLLDALERSCISHNVLADIEDGPCDCADCRLLARWKEKL